VRAASIVKSIKVITRYSFDLHHSDKLQVKDIEEEALTKLYTMSLKVKWQPLEF
jgi:hypothetical protein